LQLEYAHAGIQGVIVIDNPSEVASLDTTSAIGFTVNGTLTCKYISAASGTHTVNSVGNLNTPPTFYQMPNTNAGQDQPGVLGGTGYAVPQGASPQAALHDGRQRRYRHCLDRAFLAALSLSRARNRLAICHRFHCHTVNANGFGFVQGLAFIRGGT